MKRDKLEKHIAGLNDQAAELLDKYLKQDELLGSFISFHCFND